MYILSFVSHQGERQEKANQMSKFYERLNDLRINLMNMLTIMELISNVSLSNEE